MTDFKSEKLRLLEEKIKLQEGLPHLYGNKHYKWSREFYESDNKINLVCSANQIGKSTTQIRKCIHWATEKSLWKGLWLRPPRVFFYFYPSSYLATVEFDSKWIPDLLPRNEFKKDATYGWEASYRAGYIQCLYFNSGVTVYFKTYSQSAEDLQAATPSAIFLDEEPPEDLMPEIQARLIASDGHLHAVMTPTVGQEYWREAFELRGKSERFKDALKMQVSMFDCQEYEDGTPSHWTEDRIQRVINSCKSEQEVQRRVYGKFVADSGLKYPSFSRSRNVVDPRKVPEDWRVFIGVDSGSGGDNHPSAVVFVAVDPTFKKAVIFDGRRFDGIITTASDLVLAVKEMREPLLGRVDAIFYDYAAADLKEISLRMGESWIPAEKNHAIGEMRVNVLFKNGMLEIFRTPELEPLANELASLKQATPKNMAKDDYTDAARYALSKIPFDWSAITGEIVEIPKEKTELELRREAFMERPSEEFDLESEFEQWNELYEG